ncbi:hypothetical protein SAMN05421773_11043 [Streptomyces aidingensis]|uniref:Uncharacterized protein n=1 Tax=Streptomyces aidingensis TaxID=910347 RepID=A0A1I1PZZ1_9ACTN|nr:hypothetical protein SAMN05421773_11043 [Streptomyces aidingensis]
MSDIAITCAWVAAAGAGWLVLSTAFGLLLGRAIRRNTDY